jgi:hypothetical protein
MVGLVKRNEFLDKNNKVKDGGPRIDKVLDIQTYRLIRRCGVMLNRYNRVRSLGMVAIILIALAIPTFGQGVTKQIKIGRDSKVAGQQLSKGTTYNVKFIDDKDGELLVLRGSKELAKASYKLVKLNKPAASDMVMYNVGTDGSLSVSRLEFQGMSQAVVLE